MDEEVEYPRMLQVSQIPPVFFFYGVTSLTSLLSSFATAVADLIDPLYPHVLKLTPCHNVWQRFLRSHLCWLPSSVQTFIQRWWPRYALPDCVVLKKLQKPEYTDVFENEQAMYKKLGAARGRLVPYFYGEARCSDGTRASLISYLPWPTVLRQPAPRLTLEAFKDRIEVAIDAMAQFGVLYSDPKLNNILLANEAGEGNEAKETRIMFIDLEWVYEPEPEKAVILQYLSIMGFVRQYQRYLRVLEQENDEPWFWMTSV
ncbi:Protein kinase-like domain protein [Niveomyces insectorum RCEF 264]|uniref:Protein kinase-like domain protein n=1 Tax=Niveomyces insectorum RCEF 264 TaxID=1081102 RepID=A0A167MEX0_9HYPO|nr:Protein kinase-like domain protein [Niveomyces insectorum RCEF 264]